MRVRTIVPRRIAVAMVPELEGLEEPRSISNSQRQRVFRFAQQSKQKSGCASVLGMALLGIFVSVLAQVAVFTVNIASDGSDANPGDGVCETAPGNGICVLRAAIQETNALAGDDTIILPPDTYSRSTNVIDKEASQSCYRESTKFDSLHSGAS